MQETIEVKWGAFLLFATLRDLSSYNFLYTCQQHNIKNVIDEVLCEDFSSL